MVCLFSKRQPRQSGQVGQPPCKVCAQWSLLAGKAIRKTRRWGWIPVGLLLVFLGFVAGGALFRRRDDHGRMPNPIRDLQKAIEENNQRIDAEIAVAALEHSNSIRRIEAEHADTIAQLTKDQRRRYDELRSNPTRCAKWLTRLARGG